MDVRRFGAQYRSPSYTLTRDHARPTRPTTTSATRTTSAAPGGRCGVSPAYAVARASTARRSARSRAGSGSTGTSRNAARGRRVAAPARLGRAALVAGDRRRARAPRARRAALFDESSFAKLEIDGPGRRRRCSSGCATTGSPAASGRSPTRRCSTAAAGSSATSPSPAWPRSASRSSPAPRSATTTASGSAGTCRGDGSVAGRTTSTSQWACFGLWGPRARDVLAAAHARRPRQRGLPLHDGARDHRRRRAGARAAGHLRRRARLGALLPDRVRRSALWRTLWEAGEPHGIVAGGYRAIDSLRLEKGYRVWGADITPDETPVRGRASASASSSTRRAASSAARRWPRRRSAGPRDAAVLPGARRPALGRARQRAGAGRRRDRAAASRPAATATRSSARSPTPTCRPSTPSPAPRSRSRSSASWVDGEVARRAAVRPEGRADPGLAASRPPQRSAQRRPRRSERAAGPSDPTVCGRAVEVGGEREEDLSGGQRVTVGVVWAVNGEAERSAASELEPDPLGPAAPAK